MKKSILGLLLLMSVLFVACGKAISSKGNDYWIDNPTSNEITVKIDEQEFIIPAESNVVANLSWGKHTMDYKGERINFFCKPAGYFVDKARTFLNPTQSNYVIYNQLFMAPEDPRATEDFVDWFMQMNSDSIAISEKGIKSKEFLPFSVDNSLFITKSNVSWDYFLDEDLPEELIFRSPLVFRSNRKLLKDANYQAGQFQESKKKIFREKDFWTHFKVADSLDVHLLANKVKFSEYQPIKIKLTKIGAVKGEKYQNYLKDLEAKAQEWLTLTDPKKVVELQEELLGVKSTIARTDLRNEYLATYPDDYSFNEATNEFSDQAKIRVKKAVAGIILFDLLVVE